MQIHSVGIDLRVSLIGLEACSGAHFLGRALRKQRHDVQLIPRSQRPSGGRTCILSRLRPMISWTCRVSTGSVIA